MINLEPFALERYFAEHEFTAQHLLACSDCEPVTLSELLQAAGPLSLELWKDLKLGYTETMGHPLLRGAVAGMYDGIHAENVMVAAPQECIFLTMNALLKPGDHVICTSPAYQSLHEVARGIGCEITLWTPDESRGWHFDLKEVLGALTEKTRLMVVNFPHNPTGHVPEKGDFEELIGLLRERGVYLFSDEMYRFLEIETEAPLPAACELYDRAFSLSGLSKSFGLPGLRVGWLAVRDPDLLKRISLLKDYTTICNSAPSEILGIMALENREEILRAQRRRLHRNLGILDLFFQEFKNFLSWNRPGGGSIAFPRLLTPEGSRVFCARLVKECGILLAPSLLFGYGDHHVRIGFGREDLPDVVELFSEHLRSRLGW